MKIQKHFTWICNLIMIIILFICGPVGLNAQTSDQSFKTAFQDSNVTLIGQIDNLSGTYHVAVNASSHRVFVSKQASIYYNPDSALIYDISDPSQPVKIGYFADPTLYVSDLAARDSILYALTESNGLWVIPHYDIANATLYRIMNHQSYGVAVNEDYAYVAISGVGLGIIDVSVPLDPQPVDTLDLNDPMLNEHGVAVSGNYAYIAAERAGLFVIDISDPTNPFQAGYLADTSGWADRVAVSGNYAYVANFNGGLWVIDISDPAHPVSVTSINTGTNISGNNAKEVAINGNTAYVIDSYNGLRIIDISNPAQPFEKGYFVTPDLARDVTVSGDTVFVVDGSHLFILKDNSSVTEIQDTKPDVPASFALWQNYPNPFNPSTQIRFALSRASNVRLEVFNLAGQRAAVLVNERMEAGYHTVRWDASGMASGVYFYRITAAGFAQTRKMFLVR